MPEPTTDTERAYEQAAREISRQNGRLLAVLAAIGGHVSDYTSGRTIGQVALDRIAHEVLRAGGEIS